MAGMADYLNRTVTDPADPAALLRQAAALLHQAGGIYDEQRRAAELAQMSAGDAGEYQELEQIIQKTGAIGKDVNDFCRIMRKHGLDTAAKIAARDASLATKYADLRVAGVKGAP